MVLGDLRAGDHARTHGSHSQRRLQRTSPAPAFHRTTAAHQIHLTRQNSDTTLKIQSQRLLTTPKNPREETKIVVIRAILLRMTHFVHGQSRHGAGSSVSRCRRASGVVRAGLTGIGIEKILETALIPKESGDL